MKNIPDWLKDWMGFSEQKTSEDPKLSPKLDSKFLSRVASDLNPSSARVLSKVFAIHGVTSLISLMICPQLGFGGLSSQWSLMDVFMVFGHSACFFLCGAFFIFGTLLMSKIFLELEEQRRFFKDRLLVLPSLVIFSFGVLKMLANHHHAEDSSSIYWIMGALICGFFGSFILTHKPHSVTS